MLFLQFALVKVKIIFKSVSAIAKVLQVNTGRNCFTSDDIRYNLKL